MQRSCSALKLHLVECLLLNQEDFPRTPSPVYQHSRSSSRAANDEGDAANAALDQHLAHLRDAASASAAVAELNAIAAGMGSRSSTPIPGVSNLHQSSGPAAPVPRMASPEIPLSNNTRSASPALAMMSGVSGITLFEQFNSTALSWLMLLRNFGDVLNICSESSFGCIHFRDVTCFYQ